MRIRKDTYELLSSHFELGEDGRFDIREVGTFIDRTEFEHGVGMFSNATCDGSNHCGDEDCCFSVDEACTAARIDYHTRGPGYGAWKGWINFVGFRPGPGCTIKIPAGEECAPYIAWDLIRETEKLNEKYFPGRFGNTSSTAPRSDL